MGLGRLCIINRLRKEIKNVAKSIKQVITMPYLTITKPATEGPATMQILILKLLSAPNEL
jgi:hypothetical protein